MFICSVTRTSRSSQIDELSVTQLQGSPNQSKQYEGNYLPMFPCNIYKTVSRHFPMISVFEKYHFPSHAFSVSTHLQVSCFLSLSLAQFLSCSAVFFRNRATVTSASVATRTSIACGQTITFTTIFLRPRQWRVRSTWPSGCVSYPLKFYFIIQAWPNCGSSNLCMGSLSFP